MIDAVIFDMDGVLVDSEPLWRQVEIEVFGSVGVVLTEEQCLETIGLRLDEVVRHWLGHAPEADILAIEHRIHARILEVVAERGVAMPGALEAVEFVRSRGVRMALASSSPLRLIEVTLRRLGLSSAFEVVHSAERESLGKPHPAVYLTTAARLGVRPQRCLAIEDSLRGLVSAKAASMRCIAVPTAPHPGFALADLVLGSLTELGEPAWTRVTAQ
jgi:mannitol-1-/sugar-/sorbitol-6-/2-deoxyglucose-6-phosphatase